MMATKQLLSALKNNKAGATAVEYALIMSLIVVALLGFCSSTVVITIVKLQVVSVEVVAYSPF